MSRSFDEFCQLEYRRVFSAAFLFCGNREIAEDATQEAFSRAFARWGRLGNEPWVSGWVMTTAMNICRKTARRLLRRPPPGEASSVTDPPTTDRLEVLAALADLSSRQREAAVLYYLGDLSIHQVGELMQTSEGSVKSHLSRARQSLRQRLRHHDHESEGEVKSGG